MTHKGAIVEKALRKSGYSLTKLAKKLGISRNTLYGRFENANLSHHFIMEVGRIIYYDFTLDFPEMKEELGLTNKNPVSQHGAYQSAKLWEVEGKYSQLLEKHNQILEIVIKVTAKHELHDLHQEITKMLEKGGKI
jgi:hypothetical protein